MRPTLDLLDRVGLHDVGMPAQPHPEPALGQKPLASLLIDEKLMAKRLERDPLAARHSALVPRGVDQPHATLVDLEDLETVREPIADLHDPGHAGWPLVSCRLVAFVSRHGEAGLWSGAARPQLCQTGPRTDTRDARPRRP